MTRKKHRAADDLRLILDAFRQIVQALRLFDRAAEKRVGLSGAQLFVLQTLDAAEPMSVNELAARTHTHQSSVSVVVRKLSDRRLVTRSQAAKDKRRVLLQLTAKGRATLRSAPAAAQERLILAMQHLRSGQRRQLALSLQRIVEEMGLTDATPALFFEEAAGKTRNHHHDRA